MAQSKAAAVITYTENELAAIEILKANAQIQMRGYDLEYECAYGSSGRHRKRESK